MDTKKLFTKLLPFFIIIVVLILIFLVPILNKKNISNNDRNINGEDILANIKLQLDYGPRYLSSDGHKKLQNYLISELSKLTSNVKTQSWRHESFDGEKYDLTNIIASLYPEKQNRIILATHYDTKKYAEKNKSEINEHVPGANDGASSVAVILEVAKYLSGLKTPPNVGVDIVFFDGEEGDENLINDYKRYQTIGSNYFARNLNEFYEKRKTVSGLVLDMVCDKDLKIFKEVSSSIEAPNQVEAFFKIARQTNNFVFKDYLKHDIIDDHIALNKAGIPTVLIIDFDYKYFHTSKDTIDKCSPRSLETVTNAVLDYIYALK